MYRERRIRKQSQPFSFAKVEDGKKKQVFKKKGNFIKGSFQAIPTPSKYSQFNKTYALYGNIVLLEKDGDLIMEPSLVNNIVNYRDVQVSKLGNQKLVTLFTEKRSDVQPSDWQFLVNKLESCKDTEAKDLAESIQNFSQKYEQILMNNNISGSESQSKEELDAAKELIEKKKVKLMESYPALCFTSRFSGNEDDLVEVSVNQKLLAELGYSTDSFASTVLQEGMPQLMQWQNNSDSIVKTLMDNYFSTSQEAFQSSTFKVPLLLKSGYIKNAEIQIHLLRKKEESGFTIDTIFTILGKNTPFFQEKILDGYFNTDFLKNMSFRENEMNFFLSTFYHESPTLRYTNMNKVCRVQEITGDEDDDEMD